MGRRAALSSVVVFAAAVLARGTGAAAFHYGDQSLWPMLSGSQCGGARQSPIDIDLSQTVVNATHGELLRCSWQADDAVVAGQLFNNGHTIELQIDTKHHCQGVPGHPAGAVFDLEQLHLHWANTTGGGSEHSVNGRHSALELHMVHFNRQYGDFATALTHADGLLVIALMFDADDESHTNAELAKLAILTATTVQVPNVNRELQLSVKNLIAGSGFDLNHQRFVTYSGSLTTPNCLEVVTWAVAYKSMTVGRDTIQLLSLARDAVQNTVSPNNRVIQARNGRPLTISFESAGTVEAAGAVSDPKTPPDVPVIAGLVIGAVAALALVGLLIIQIRKQRGGAAYQKPELGAAPAPVEQVQGKVGAPASVVQVQGKANGPEVLKPQLPQP